MPLILAIEPDRQQAARVSALAPAHIQADIVVVDSVSAALRALDSRVPDLVLTPLLLSAKDDAALTQRLRELDAGGGELQTLVIPVLASPDAETATPERGHRLFNRIRKPRAAASSTDGCQPGVFAQQINEYLGRLAAERRDREEAARVDQWASPHVTASAPLLAELLPMRGQTTASASSQRVEVYHPVRHGEVQVDAVEATLELTVPQPTEQTDIVSTADDHVVEPSSLAEDARPGAPVVEPDIRIDTAVPEGEPGDHDDSPAQWEDLETFLEDLEVENAVPALDTVHAADEPDPAVVDLAASDELWTPLASAPTQHIAPIEGPELGRRKPARPAKTPKAPRGPRAQSAVPTRPVSKNRADPKPMQDEWGLYDPEQCGFAALLNRLEELTSQAEAERPKRAKRSAIMRR